MMWGYRVQKIPGLKTGLKYARMTTQSENLQNP